MSGTINANVQGQTALVQMQAAAAQVAVATNSPGTVLSFSPGSILLAIVEAVAGVCLWLQGLILNLLLVSRVTTSTGSDVDSWMAQFQFPRIAAAAATCATVVLSRYSSSVAVTIPPGGLVQTSDGTQQFAIVADTTQSGYSVAAGGYVMASGVSSVQVTVQAVDAGAGGNVSAGTITAFASGIIGADTVTNTGAATGGSNAESDTAFRARFWLYLAYLFRCTGPAVQYAIQKIQSGLTVTITDGYNAAGTLTPGFFFATVDDGTGSPSAALIAAASAQVQATRALGIQAAAYAPTTVGATVAATIATTSPATDGPAANAAATAFMQAIVLGQNASFFRLGAAIQNASPTIAELVSLTINGVSADLTVGPTQKIVLTSVTISTVA